MRDEAIVRRWKKCMQTAKPEKVGVLSDPSDKDRVPAAAAGVGASPLDRDSESRLTQYLNEGRIVASRPDG